MYCAKELHHVPLRPVACCTQFTVLDLFMFQPAPNHTHQARQEQVDERNNDLIFLAVAKCPGGGEAGDVHEDMLRDVIRLEQPIALRKVQLGIKGQRHRGVLSERPLPMACQRPQCARKLWRAMRAAPTRNFMR